MTVCRTLLGKLMHVLGDQYEPPRLSKLRLEGFKSFSLPQEIAFSRLTVMAGVNSSGKSTALQPLLLLKQTLETRFESDGVWLEGPNARFTHGNQLISRGGVREGQDATFKVSISSTASETWNLEYELHGQDITIKKLKLDANEPFGPFVAGMTTEEIEHVVPKDFVSRLKESTPEGATVQFETKAVDGFIELFIHLMEQNQAGVYEPVFDTPSPTSVTSQPKSWLRNMIHLPGLRGNPERTYKKAKASAPYSGLFQDYFASIILDWSEHKDQRLDQLGQNMLRLGLSWKVAAKQVESSRLEILVGRTVKSYQGSAYDTVSLADVGLGASQVLPVLVALEVALPGSYVYVEQPEIHLHPRAQFLLAEIVAGAVNRGVNVIIETHSPILLLGVARSVADHRIKAEDTALNWFSRDETSGVTSVSSSAFSRDGKADDWPADFAEVEYNAMDSLWDAQAKQLKQGGHPSDFRS